MKPASKLFHSRKRGWDFFSLVLLALFFVAVPSLVAQGYGSVSGTVTDPSGAAIPNATITATEVDTGRVITVTSGDAGTFVFTTLPPASYTFKVTA